MTDQNEIDQKKAVRKNDLRFAGVVLTLYTICCILFGVGAFFSVKEDRENQIANVTATEAAFATRQAHSTATEAAIATQQIDMTVTASVRIAEHNQYEYIERFDETSSLWFVGTYDKKYGDIQINIQNGVYTWDIRDAKTFTQSTEFLKENMVGDFDVYMDVKFVESSYFGGACSGFFFRMPTNDWNDGAYTFVICDDSHYEIQFYEKNKWKPITFSDYENIIHAEDWNRIEISARKDHFIFTINNVEVFEMTDSRSAFGSLGIFNMLDDNGAAEIWFDNFGFQRR